MTNSLIDELPEKWTPQRILTDELQTIAAALRFAKALSRKHGEKIEYMPQAEASIKKIRTLFGDISTKIDEAKFDGMMAQREVDKYLNGKSDANS